MSGPAGWKRFPLCFYLIAAAAVAIILSWGVREKGPTHWDDSWYLAASVRLFDRFASEGLAGYWRGFEHALGDKAPLITVLPFPFFCLIGRSVFVIYLVNSAACLALAASLYLFTREFFGERVSLLAVFFALFSPLLLGLSRLFLVEYWLTALVVSSLFALARWERTGRQRWALGLGVLCGLGLLMKITFPLFVAPVVAVILWRAQRTRRSESPAGAAGTLTAAVAAILIVAPAVLLAGPWYVNNWDAITHRSFQESYFVPVHPTERQSPLGMAVDYIFILLSYAVSAVQVAAAAGGITVWTARRRNFLGAAVFYIVPWVITLPVFALSENRDVRLIAPMAPAFAIATAALFELVLSQWKRASRCLLAAAAVFSLLIAIGNSFPVFGSQTLRLGRWLIFAPNMGYAFAPNPDRWPLDQVLERIARRERLGPRSKMIVGLGADTWSFNSNNLDLEAALLKYPFEFYTTAYTSSRNQVRRIMSSTQYFLWKDGGTQQPLGRFQGGPMTIDFLRNGPLFREVPPGIPAPDGGLIRIFENASAGPDMFSPARQPAPAAELYKTDLNFGNLLQIAGLRLTEHDGIFTLALRWRCLTPPAMPVRCFAHVVDAEGKLLSSMDHEILHGSPPVTEWQPGDEGYEARYLALPPAAARGAQVRLGLFDPESRRRIPLWASTAPLKDDYTAAVFLPNQPPAAEYQFQMGPAPVVACNVEFEGGLRLTGYSLRRRGDVAWLRLCWSARRRPKAKLYFFGHAVADQSAGTPILLSFDEETGLNRTLPSPDGQLTLIQDIVRDVSKLSGQAKFLRAGVFDIDRPLDRLAIRSSTLTMSKQQKAIFLPLPPRSSP